MAKSIETSFELDVEESSNPASKPVSKPGPPLRKTPPKQKVHNVPEIVKEEPKKESPPKEPETPVANPNPTQQSLPSLEAHPVKHSSSRLSDTHHEAIVNHPTKDHSNLLGIHVDPVTATVVGTAAAVAAGTAAVTTGIATPAITAVKIGIIKAKAALGISSKAAAVAGTATVAGAVVVALEKKFTDYEKDIQSVKEDVGDIGEQLKKLDKLLDSVKK